MKNFISLFFSLLIFHFSFSQSWLWGKNGIGEGQVFSVASDLHGNCYISGFFPNDTLHFGSFTLRNPSPYNNSDDAFLVKYAPNGNVLWAKQTTDIVTSNAAVTSAPTSIATDGKGNIYLNGNFPDTLLVGKYKLVINSQSIVAFSTFLAKYDSSGNVIWAKQAMLGNDSSEISGVNISCNNKADCFITGSFVDTIQFSSYKISTPSPNIVFAFIAKYDSSGNVKWARQSTGYTKYGVSAYGVTSDVFGYSIITGSFEDSAVFGSYKLGSTILSQYDGVFFITKYDSTGNVLWAKQATIANVYSGCIGVSATTDKIGNIYICGNFTGTVTLGLYTLVGPNAFQYQNSFFLAKYDPSGNVLWVKQANVLDNNSWGTWGLSIDNYKHIYLSANGGFGQCKVAFGGDTLSMNDTAKNDGASVIFKLDSNGKALCSTIIPVSSYGNALNAVASDTSGKYVYFGGIALSTAIFGKDTVNPFLYPAYYGLNLVPFVARWEACDSAIFADVTQSKNPSEQVNLYPNPNKGTFTIALQNVNELVQVEIYNILGEEIQKTKLNEGNTQINLGSQPNGVFFYRVIGETSQLFGQGKIIVEK
jgi:hypothetical protein